MKAFVTYFATSYITSFLLILSIQSRAQGIGPLHLFNTGINMGHLSEHVSNGTGTGEYGVWAGNASAEWIASWSAGLVRPVVPDIEMPSAAHNEFISMMTTMPLCSNPYFQARLSIYRAGYNLGKALVQTETPCSQCLQTEMQKAAVELRTISSIISKTAYADMSNNLNRNAANLNTRLFGETAGQQNKGLFDLINATIKRIQADLPSGLVYCQPQPSEPAPREAREPAVQDRKKQAFILKAGLNSGYLKGDQGTDTDPKSGFHVGFDMYKGNPVFLVVGLKFFRNSTGEELMIPLPGQVVDSDDHFIQGFNFGAGVGFYAYQNEDIKVTLTGKLTYIISHAIDGNLTSIGNTSVSDGALHLEAGAGVAYKLLFFEISYEPGLTKALFFGTERMNYRLLNIGIGLRF